jgi:hypothetical protein
MHSSSKRTYRRDSKGKGKEGTWAKKSSNDGRQHKLAIHTNARLELEKMKVEFKILLSSIVNN